MIKLKRIFVALAAGSILSCAANSYASSSPHTKLYTLMQQGVPHTALTEAFNAYQWALNKGQVRNKRYLTVVDFSLPSTVKRLWVIDLNRAKVIYHELVTHGKGSGAGRMATRFSDQVGSDASVLGVIITENSYYGKHGFSLRLTGIENINNKVKGRAIVIHPAFYATSTFAHNYGYLGHSWGCFALDPRISNKVINMIQDGSVIFAYAHGLHRYGKQA